MVGKKIVYKSECGFFPLRDTRRTKMSYTCQNCGVTTDDQRTLCNPVVDEENDKLCERETFNVCEDNAAAIEYSCPCGNVSAEPEHLCHPTRMWDE
jgi:hypothetical protein